MLQLNHTESVVSKSRRDETIGFAVRIGNLE